MAEVPVRVIVRVRPMLEQERLRSRDLCVQFVSHDQLVIGKDRAFRFDWVFPPDTSQAVVYEKSVTPLVASCLEGYNATVFAYGQTGSGKSYTMGSEHLLDSGHDRSGMIPRALEDIFQHIQRSKPGVEFSVDVSYIEIYKEELRDLIDNTMTAREILIREDEEGHTVVVGATEQPVSSAEEALSWLEVGNTARITGATQMNQRSSRSHAVFTILIKQRWKVAGELLAEEGVPAAEGSDGTSVEQCLSAKFHFVDLAGSEKAGKTGNRGERFKESVHINSGLLALGNVISALGDLKRKSSHVPYRESKITRLLKDSLGGNARTAMITCLSPAAANFAENLNSLKYAKRARNICNRPVINQDPQASKFQELHDEIQALREELLRNQASKPSTARTVMTVDSSVMVELSDTELQMRELEQELKLSHEQCAHYQVYLQSAAEQLSLLRSADILDPHQLHQLEEWLRSLQGQEGFTGKEADFHLTTEVTPADMAAASQSPVSKRALETIELLRSELERCQVDLETDEELFAEKVEEVNELQKNYDLLLQEKERIERLWVSAKETDTRLQSEVQQLLEKLFSVENELSEREAVIQQRRDSLEKEDETGGVLSVKDHVTRLSVGVQASLATSVESESETREASSDKLEHQSEVLIEEEEDNSVDSLQGESGFVPLLQQTLVDFTANRSLLDGKVETTRMEDFTDEAVLKSMQILTECLVEHQEQNDQPPVALLLGEGYKRIEQTSQKAAELGQTRTIRSGGDTVPSIVPSSVTHGEEPSTETPVLSEQSQGKIHRDTSDALRASTPIEASLQEPDTSRAGQRWCHWHMEDARVDIGEKSEICKTKSRTKSLGLAQGDEEDEVVVMAEVDLLNESAIETKKQLVVADTKLLDAQDEMRNLNTKIKLKEELIRELVKNSRTMKGLNESYLSKIQKLEREAFGLQKELHGARTTLQKQKEKAQESGEMQKRVEDHKKKLAATESKLAALQKKQRETQRMMHIGMKSEKRINELESGIERLRNHQEILKRKLKKQSGKKTKLENDLQKYQQRIKELQTHSDQQSKVLKVKTEEAAAAQRKLRQFSSRPSSHTSEISKFEAKKWLDGEMEKILQKKQAMEELEKDLAERERIVTEKETLTAQRDALERRKLRSSQAAARDIVSLSLQIDSIESALSVKMKDGTKLSKQDEVARLTRERNELIRKREGLKQKIEASSLLPPGEEIRLHELNEHIEVLEAAVDFKNDSIASKHLDMREIVESGVTAEIDQKFEQLSLNDARMLLARYFNKVVNLRVTESHHQQQQRELEVKISEQQETIHRLGRTLKQAEVEKERRLLAQQKDHQQQVQFLMQQLAEGEGTSRGSSQELLEEESKRVQALEVKLKAVEKDLYYYKKTSRDLRKKVQELSGEKKGDSLQQTPAKSSDATATVHHEKAHTVRGGDVEPMYSHSLTQVQDIVASTPSTGETQKRSSSTKVTIKQQKLSGGTGQIADGKVSYTHRIVRKPKKQLRQLSASDIADRITHKANVESTGAKEKHKDE